MGDRVVRTQLVPLADLSFAQARHTIKSPVCSLIVFISVAFDKYELTTDDGQTSQLTVKIKYTKPGSTGKELPTMK